MKTEQTDVYQYLRHEKKFPLIWCPGCGNGIVMGSMIRAVDALGMAKDKTSIVSGIGCSGRVSTYMDFNTLHTTHGRALAFATGLKFARPELTVIVAMGDGDALAIGGNHFIHAARRNIDLTAIIFNNSTYGMTGGQISPTTPLGSIASTARMGNIENPFDVPKLAEAAGAAFVARGSAYHVDELDELMALAIRKKGFSVLEVITPCPTIYGRNNRLGSVVNMLKQQRDSLVSMHDVQGMSPEELKGKTVLGVLADLDKPEYCEEYEKLMERAQKA
ncbi:MAG: 2-oxoacid:ferredoxin oxidoreductase subunit beta [Proteobacteria bacterium]|jgi:2-oxoglutarate ferredoxin oxidoreductase subunit beta|nr:2-oxoacid:ferredoxin oxidoreductase subunit beta [Pseudomonadota bacterium]